MAVGDVYRVAIEGELNGSQVVNVCHYQTEISVGGVAAELEGLGEAMLSSFVPAYADMCTPQWSFVKCAVRGVTNPLLGTDVTQVGVSGTRTGDAEPSQIGGLLNLRCGVIGRRSYGRMTLPAIPDADVVNGRISSDYSSDAVDFLSLVIQILDVPVTGLYRFRLAVHSYTYSQTFQVTTGFVSASPGTQRRRKLGRGA